MRNSLLIVTLLLIQIANTFGQTDTSTRKIFTAVERNAYYKNGGMVGFQKHINDNFRLPPSYKLVNTGGRMLVVFVIDSTGSNYIEEIKNELTFVGNPSESVIRLFVTDCETEIRRVFAKMPKWIPGTQDGVPVKARFTFPLNVRTR